MLKITNLKASNDELTEQKKKEVFGGVIALTTVPFNILPYLDRPSLDKYFAEAQRLAEKTGLSRGAALND